MPVITVEEVNDRPSWRRFHDLPMHLHRDDAGFVHPVRGLERWRLDPKSNPFFGRGHATIRLARWRGKVAGRIVASWLPDADGTSWFGHLEVDLRAGTKPAESIGRALLDACVEWATERDAKSLVGPVAVHPIDEQGLRVDGFDTPAAVLVPWHPPEYLAVIEALGGAEVSRREWIRASSRALAQLAAPRGGDSAGGALRPVDPQRGDLPPSLVPYLDERLVLAGGKSRVVAVPDIVGGLAGVGLRGAWGAARRARQRTWETCVVSRVEGGRHPARLIGTLAATAERHGYREIVVPGHHLPGRFRSEFPTVTTAVFEVPLSTGARPEADAGSTAG